MMTTFMSIMIPRAAVCAERIIEVLDMIPASRRPPRRSCPRARPQLSSCVGSRYRYESAAAPVLSDISFVAQPDRSPRSSARPARARRLARADPAAR
jgi:ATP-binding cassette subfamily B protein